MPARRDPGNAADPRSGGERLDAQQVPERALRQFGVDADVEFAEDAEEFDGARPGDPPTRATTAGISRRICGGAELPRTLQCSPGATPAAWIGAPRAALVTP